ncbi:MAG: NADH-quinone oxidoreductase subunit NuoK [Coriobacteriia bacterium]|nr:NADH-quinone oxidoreductase subunit NuoK [Coriobacteriia bacterium]
MRFGIEPFLMLAAVLFSIGLYGALSKKATVQLLLSLELMAMAVNINLVAFARFVTPMTMDGVFFAVFTMVVSAAEVGLGLGLVIAIYRSLKSSEVTSMNELKG